MLTAARSANELGALLLSSATEDIANTVPATVSPTAITISLQDHSTLNHVRIFAGSQSEQEFGTLVEVSATKKFPQLLIFGIAI
jgi:hypothetical protein